MRRRGFLHAPGCSFVLVTSLLLAVNGILCQSIAARFSPEPTTVTQAATIVGALLLTLAQWRLLDRWIGRG